MDFGYVPTSTTLYFYFCTYNSAGASVTMSGFATSDIKIFKNGSTTERNSTAGFTLLDTDGIDFDGVTGIQGFSIDTSDDTDAGFYAAGNQYTVFVSTVTVDSQTVTLRAGSFFLGPQQADVRQYGGTAGTFSGGRPEVKTDSLGSTAKSDVNAEVVDCLNVDTYAEPGQATPGATTTLVTKLGYLYKAWRNKSTSTSSQYSLYNDDAATVDQKASLDDTGSTATKGEVATGP
jgi:hypothetical protein